MRHRRVRKRPMAEINVVPYIDVMLVLLVIFMITAPLLTQGVKVDLPQAKAKQIKAQKQEPIIVSVDARGNYFLNIAPHPDRPLAARTLTDQISAEIKRHRQRQVLVKGDKHVDYGKVVQAMVLLQQAGADQVGLMTQQND